MKTAALVIATFGAILVLAVGSGTAANQDVLRVSPPAVSFGTKPVGSFTLKGARVSNAGSSTVNVIVTIAREPDDFSFGLLPGSTCPVFEPAPLAPGESCVAVVGFRPSDFFAGHEQSMTLLATATDPTSGAIVDAQTIDFSGRGKSAPA